jgi:hypothetical protein
MGHSCAGGLRLGGITIALAALYIVKARRHQPENPAANPEPLAEDEIAASVAAVA